MNLANSSADASFRKELETAWREHWELRRLFAEFKLDLYRLGYLRKYSPDQPRVPAGSSNGGQWTDEGESSDDDDELTDFSAARKRGHHYVTRDVFGKAPLPKETLKVLDDATTGPLLDKRSNRYDAEHRQYNKAVKDHFERFVSENGIQKEQMTPDQARTFLNEVLESKDPRIRNFNMRIHLREIMKRGPLRPRGNE